MPSPAGFKARSTLEGSHDSAQLARDFLPLQSITTPKYIGFVSGRQRFLTEFFQAMGNMPLECVPPFTSPDQVFRPGQLFLYRHHPFDRLSYQIWLLARVDEEVASQSTALSPTQCVWERIHTGHCPRNLFEGTRYVVLRKDFTPVWVTKSTYVTKYRKLNGLA